MPTVDSSFVSAADVKTVGWSFWAETYHSIAQTPQRYHCLHRLEDVLAFGIPHQIMEGFKDKLIGWYQELQKRGVRGGKDLYLFGPHNSGKTSLSILAMLAVVDLLEDLPDPFYLHVGAALTAIRQHDFSLVQRAVKASVLVLDDIGVESGSDFIREQLSSLLDSRFGSGYPNIVTGNSTPEDLSKVLGQRAASRILRTCLTFEIAK